MNHSRDENVRASAEGRRVGGEPGYNSPNLMNMSDPSERVGVSPFSRLFRLDVEESGGHLQKRRKKRRSASTNEQKQRDRKDARTFV